MKTQMDVWSCYHVKQLKLEQYWAVIVAPTELSLENKRMVNSSEPIYQPQNLFDSIATVRY